jgi:hypothetical protein
MAKDAPTLEATDIVNTATEAPSTEVIAESIESTTITEKIESTSITEPGGKKKKRKQKFSSRIVLGAHTSLFPMVCSDTGAVAAITIPTIPGKAFIYRSPFAVIGNCHSIAAEGPEYLYKLEAQLLAAIVITLAAEYRLFQYQPSDTGAQKNAVLRTVRRETLVSAILFIHSTVNSFRASKIPSLSCIPSEDMLEYGMDTRMTLWLKTCIDCIFPPVSAKDAPTANAATKQEDYFLEEEESEAKIQKKISAQTHALTKAKLATTRRNFKTFKNESVANIKYLYTGQKISLKLKNFLLGILSEELLISSDGAMVDLLCTKLDQLNLEIAAKLAIGIKRFRREFTEQTLSEFATDSAPTFGSMPIGKYDATEQSEENEFASDAPTPASTVLPTTPSATAAMVANASVKPMSFMERVRMKKQLTVHSLAQQNLPAPTNVQQDPTNLVSNEFGIPTSSLLHSSSISNMPGAPF